MDNPVHKLFYCIFLIANVNLQSTLSQQYLQFQPAWTPSDRLPNPSINFKPFNSSLLGVNQNPGKLVHRDGPQSSPSGVSPSDRRLPFQVYGPPPSLGSGSPGSESSVGNSRYIPNTSTSISGDYCWDPLFACDTAHTILYCLNARCTCPSGWTIAPGNLPLNTVWYPAAKRCVSLIGSGCHTSAATVSSGYVDCQPGVRCIPHPSYKEVGTCGGANLKFAIGTLFPLWIFQFLIRSV